MKLRQMIPKRKLRATAARRVAQPRIEEEDAEPTMKLSSAFVVVVLLHLVAVGGIYTFESIKAHRPPAAQAETAAAMEAAAPPLPVAPGAAAKTSLVASNVSAPARASAPVKATKTVETKSAAETPKKTAPAAAEPAGPRDSGAIHTVVKGENPVSIARKLGVNYEDLLKLNRIEDPRKLQVGQELHIPVKTKTASHASH